MCVPSSLRMYLSANDSPVSLRSTIRTLPKAPRPTTRRRRKWFKLTKVPCVLAKEIIYSVIRASGRSAALRRIHGVLRAVWLGEAVNLPRGSHVVSAREKAARSILEGACRRLGGKRLTCTVEDDRLSLSVAHACYNELEQLERARRSRIRFAVVCKCSCWFG